MDVKEDLKKKKKGMKKKQQLTTYNCYDFKTRKS